MEGVHTSMSAASLVAWVWGVGVQGSGFWVYDLGSRV